MRLLYWRSLQRLVTSLPHSHEREARMGLANPVRLGRRPSGKSLAAIALVLGLVALLLPAALGLATASAIEQEPIHVNFTLEGCRAAPDAYLPGTFTCPDAAYTTGNLAKGWNELDLVPHRLTTS